MYAPKVTRAPVAPAGEQAPLPTRARRGEVPPEEAQELRADFGFHLFTLRVMTGLTQAELAARAGLSEWTVRELEHGRVRPSDATCAKLAAGLHPHADALTVAIADLSLQAAAGPSLRPRQRRKPPRLARQRLYDQARRVLAEHRHEDELRAMGALVAQMITPVPADPFEGGRRPAVRR